VWEFLWGSAWIPYSVLLHHVPGLFASALRFLIAAVFTTLVALAAGRRESRASGDNSRGILIPSVVLGITELALPYALAVWAVDRASDGLSLTLYALIPLVALLLNRGSESAAIPKLVVGAGGAAILASSGFSISAGQLIGALLIAGAVASQAFSLNYAKGRIDRNNLIASVAIQFAVASVLLGLLSLLTEHRQLTDINRDILLSLIFLGIAISSVSMPLVYWMLTEWEPWQVGALYWITILVSVIEAAVLLRAGPSMEMLAGAALIVGAVIWLLRGDDGGLRKT
jgi:drug/metabolite transporter (DMT)-like permease